MKTMKTIINIVFCVALSLMLASCFDSKRSNEDTVINVSATEDSVNCNLEEILEVTEVIPVNGDSKIVSVGKIAFAESEIYVLDDIQKSIYTIAQNGVSKRIINAVGRGHGEYNSVDDIEVGDDGTLFLLDSESQKINHYNRDGKFIGTIRSCVGERMAICNNKFYVNCGLNEEFNVAIINMNGAKENTIPSPHDYPPMNIGNGCVAIYNDRVYLTNPFDHTIYNIKDGVCVPVINFDFKSKALGDDILNETDMMTLHEKVLKSDKIVFIQSFAMAGDYLLVVTDSNDKYLYNIATNRCVCLNMMPQPYAILFSGYLTIDGDGQFVAMVSESNMRNLTSDAQIVSENTYLKTNKKLENMSNDEFWIIRGRLFMK